MPRSTPRNASDAIYDRLVEVQEGQAIIAREQAAAGKERDLIMHKVVEALVGLTEIIKARQPVIELTAKGVDAIPHIVQKSVTEIVAAVTDKIEAAQASTLDRVLASLALIGKAQRKQGWLLPLAVFFGSAIGEVARGWIPTLIR